MTSGFEIRPIVEDEFDAWSRAISRGFGRHPRREDQTLHRVRCEYDRTLAAMDGGRIVGTAGTESYEMTVPGGAVVPTAGVSAVTVQATHRRRGILRDMMRRQLQDVHDRGEALAILWTSESLIYGRFGYGMAITHERWEIETAHSEFARHPEPGGEVAFAEPDAFRKAAPEVWERVRLQRSGMIRLSDLQWDYRLLDPEYARYGASAFFFATYQRDGRTDGYVAYRTRGNWEAGIARSTIEVTELMAATDEAHAALWRFCLDVDLITEVRAHGRPVDDPLLWMLNDPRRLRRSPRDAVWLRLVDVRAALAGRRYDTSGRLVFAVRDSFCSWNVGTYVLEGSPKGADCRRSDAGPDIVLDVADLAACYFGSVPFSTLSHAGRVEERTPGALGLADRMFASDPSPWCPHSF